MTSPHREAGDAVRERPGIIYPLLPRAARPDTRVAIEAAAFSRQSRPPTVLDIAGTSLPESTAYTDTGHDEAIPQVQTPSLIGRLQAIQMLSTERTVVWLGHPPGINKLQSMTWYKRTTTDDLV